MDEFPVLTSYKRKDVDEFLISLNASHNRAVAEKDGEIKRLFSECEYYKQESIQKDDEIQRLKAEYEEKLSAVQKEVDTTNARLGEKLSAAEKASSLIIAEAKVEKEKLLNLAKEEADAYVARIKVQSDEYCEKAKRLSDIFRDHQQKALQSLDIMNKHLDSAVEDVAKLFSGNSK